jgi:CheY-like chemotaxis protein
MTFWRQYIARMANILIVDDNQDASAGLEKILTAAGHQVTSVPNGREALLQVLSHPPDVVLLDLMMPEMDGPSFLQVVRLYLRNQSLPVVVLTGFTESPLIERALHLKVNSVLVKGKASSKDIQQALEQAIGSTLT